VELGVIHVSRLPHLRHLTLAPSVEVVGVSVAQAGASVDEPA
jgi:hypothetical protein